MKNDITLENCHDDEKSWTLKRISLYIGDTHDLLTEQTDSSPRRRHANRPTRSITLHCCSCTTVEDVGLQLWSGALLLADYLIHISSSLSPFALIELGAGIGLTSIIASLLPCQYIIATDYQQDILNLIERNIASNSHLLPLHPLTNRAAIYCRIVDWIEHVDVRAIVADNDSSNDKLTLHTLQGLPYIYLAADCIYDDELTFHFFSTAAASMRPGEHLLLTLEKRYNFVISELDVVAHAYGYFCDIVQSVASFEVSGKQVRFVGRRVDIDFPRYLTYDRSTDLELWDIQIDVCNADMT